MTSNMGPLEPKSVIYL